MIYYKTPSNEKDYLKGATEVSMIQEKYNKNWHSIEDATYRQYAQIFFPYLSAKRFSYLNK